MVTNKIKIDNDKEVRQLIADEGKLLFLNYELEELGEEAKGVPEVLIPMDWDFENLYVEKEITTE